LVLIYIKFHDTYQYKTIYDRGGIIIGKSIIQENERILMGDKVIYFKSSREAIQCEICLTNKRIIAYNKSSSFFKTIKNLFKDSEVVFEVPLCSINSIRDGQLYQKNLVIFRTSDGTEYPLHFNSQGQKLKDSIVDEICKSEPDVVIKEVGDYIRFKRQQPRQ